MKIINTLFGFKGKSTDTKAQIETGSFQKRSKSKWRTLRILTVGIILAIANYFILYHMIAFSFNIARYFILVLIFLVIYLLFEYFTILLTRNSSQFVKLSARLVYVLIIIILWGTSEKILLTLNNSIKNLISTKVTIYVCLDSTNISSSLNISKDDIERLLKMEKTYLQDTMVNISKRENFEIVFNKCDISKDSNSIQYPIDISKTDIETDLNGDTIIIHEIKTNDVFLNSFVFLCTQKNIITDSIKIDNFPDATLYTPQTLAMFLRAKKFIEKHQYEYAIECYRRITQNMNTFVSTRFHIRSKRTKAIVLQQKVAAILSYIDNESLSIREKNEYKNEALLDMDNIIHISRIQSLQDYCNYLIYGLFVYNKFIDWETLNKDKTKSYQEVDPVQLSYFEKLEKINYDYNEKIRGEGTCIPDYKEFGTNKEEIDYIQNKILSTRETIPY